MTTKSKAYTASMMAMAASMTSHGSAVFFADSDDEANGKAFRIAKETWLEKDGYYRWGAQAHELHPDIIEMIAEFHKG